MVVFYASCEGNEKRTAKEILSKSFDNIRNKTNDDYGEPFEIVLRMTNVYVDVEYNGAWAGAALVFKAKE